MKGQKMALFLLSRPCRLAHKVPALLHEEPKLDVMWPRLSQSHPITRAAAGRSYPRHLKGALLPPSPEENHFSSPQRKPGGSADTVGEARGERFSEAGLLEELDHW